MLTRDALQGSWERARMTIGRPDLRLHDMRHTGLTLAAATGATTAELMHRAGHASAPPPSGISTPREIVIGASPRLWRP